MSRRRVSFEWDTLGPEDDDDVVRILRHHFAGLCSSECNPLVSTTVPGPLPEHLLRFVEDQDDALELAAERQQ